MTTAIDTILEAMRNLADEFKNPLQGKTLKDRQNEFVPRVGRFSRLFKLYKGVTEMLTGLNHPDLALRYLAGTYNADMFLKEREKSVADLAANGGMDYTIVKAIGHIADLQDQLDELNAEMEQPALLGAPPRFKLYVQRIEMNGEISFLCGMAARVVTMLCEKKLFNEADEARLVSVAKELMQTEKDHEEQYMENIKLYAIAFQADTDNPELLKKLADHVKE